MCFFRFGRHALYLSLTMVMLMSCSSDDEPAASATEDTATAGDSGTTGADGADGTDGGECIELASGSCVTETYANPPELQPDDRGVYVLNLQPSEVTLKGERHCVRAYNGVYGGPTIVTPARQGDEQRQVHVDIVNRFETHAATSLDGSDTCTCTDKDTGMSCEPSHDPCTKSSCVCTDEDGAVCHVFDFNVTNLHAHGSHVRPDYSRGAECEPYMADGVIPVRCRRCAPSACDTEAPEGCFHADDVISTVHPFEGARHRWDIDEDHTHHEGLQWYHPHIHGTTSIQVASGAAGAWIVRGPLDEVPGIANATERVMVFSTPPLGDSGFQPLQDGQECNESNITCDNFATLGDVAALQTNLINGQHQPRMLMAPGQIERWRLLHAGFLDEVAFGLFHGTDENCTSWDTSKPVQLVQIARDGLVMPQTHQDDYIFMSPGYRVEAVLDGNALAHGDTLCLASARFLQEGDQSIKFAQDAVGLQSPITGDEITARLGAGELVAIVNVTDNAGPATETTPPDYTAVAALAPSLELDGVSIETRCADAAAVEAPADVDQVAILQVGYFTADDPDPCNCDNYNVNCKNYENTDRSRYPYDRDLPLGQVQHWRVSASLDGQPFHIHINPYVVCPNDNPFDPPFAHWRDTYLVNLQRRVDIIAQYETYDGAFVFHCHKLTHEDHGMMELIRVCAPDDPTCGDYVWNACADGDTGCLQKVAATECSLEPNPLQCLSALEACQAGPPGSACAADQDCTLPATCVDSVCKLPAGAACVENDECASGTCTDPAGPAPAACE